MDLTMKKYTNEKNDHALSQMSAPHNKSVAEMAQLTGGLQRHLFASTW